ncbi:WbqC family protein [Chloroflexota bacterium]
MQPNYIPWRGYFHQILLADVFVFYDDVQYDKHGWRNRNRVKTPNGTQWLTIPVKSVGVLENNTPIKEVEIDWTKDWSRKHWATINQAYGKAPYFKQYREGLKHFFQKKYDHLADLTIDLTIHLSNLVRNQQPQFLRSSDMEGIQGIKTERLLQILQRLEADHYISGPSAGDYLDESILTDNGITLEYMQYDYREYPQMYPPFDGQVSILDLLFMTGDEAIQYIL